MADKEKIISLYELLETLTTSERGYCSKQLSLAKSKSDFYSKLFKGIIKKLDKVNAHIQLDEQLQKQFKKDLGKQSFSAAKNYLYNQILNFLQDYSAQSSINQQLSDLYNQSVVLAAKRLRQQSLVLIEKGLALAKKHELYAFECMFSHRKVVELKLMNHFSNMEDSIADLNQSLLKHNTFLKLDAFRCELMETYHTYYHFNHNHPKVKSILNNPIITDPLPIKTYTIENLHLKIISAIHSFSNNKEKQFELNKSLLFLHKAYPNITVNGNWLSVKSYVYLQSVISLKRLDLLNEAWAIFDSCDFANKIGFVRQQFLRYHLIFLQHYIVKLDENAFELTVKEYEHFYAKNEKYCQPDKKISLPFHIAIVYFDLNKFEKTLHWIEVIYVTGNMETKRNYRTASRIIEIVAHYELGNIELLESLVRSCYRYFEKLNKKTELDKVFIGFVRKLPQIKSENELLTHFKQTKVSIDKVIKTHPLEANQLEYFDIQTWLESKITGKPFAELRRSKA